MQEMTITPSLQMLLDIAQQLIQEKGCRSTTLQEIAERGGVTKGAIYHYVKSKDELFAMILELQLEEANRQFFESISDVVSKQPGAAGPFHTISQRLASFSSEDNIFNQIFIYLLSQKDKPAINQILTRLEQASLRSSQKWIEFGQENNAIPAQIDAKKMAHLFAIFKRGLQVQSILSPEFAEIDAQDIYQIIVTALSANKQT